MSLPQRCPRYAVLTAGAGWLAGRAATRHEGNILAETFGNHSPD